MMNIKLNGDGTTRLSLLVKHHIQPYLIEDEIIRRALEDIEHVYKIEGLAMYSTDWGVKSPESLSNGMKCLILLTCPNLGPDVLLSNACMGENCAKYLAELSFKYDFTIAWDSFLSMPTAPVCARDVDTGKVFETGWDIIEYYMSKPGDPAYCDW